MKNYYTQENVGNAKYTVNYHNGESKHPDGSPFYDIATFKNKNTRNGFVEGLVSQGYKVGWACNECMSTPCQNLIN